MLTLARKLLGRSEAQSREYKFSRPLVVIQSDDWGRVGVCDREGFEQLRQAGIQLGERSYDFYSLETAEDCDALRTALSRHRDSVGRAPSVVMNFMTANLDCAATLANHEIVLKPLAQGLPGSWQRLGLFEAYQRGIADGVFWPALHGRTHFCPAAVVEFMNVAGERSELLQSLWQAGTPYIHWRMPWVGYEYWHPERKPSERFLSSEQQGAAIRQAASEFEQLFGCAPLSACAPGYRANADTYQAWSACGVRVAQNGPGIAQGPSLDGREMLSLFRNIEFEPATSPCDVAACIQQAEACFARGIPAIVSMHSINLHSTLRDFRTTTLRMLDEFFSVLESRHADLLYVHDHDLFQIVQSGQYEAASGTVRVAAREVK